MNNGGFHGPTIPFGAEIFLSSHFHNRQERASSILLNSPQRYFHRLCLERLERLDKTQLVADAEALQKNRESELHVKSSDK